MNRCHGLGRLLVVSTCVFAVSGNAGAEIYLSGALGSADADGGGFSRGDSVKLSVGMKLNRMLALEGSVLQLGKFEADDSTVVGIADYNEIDATDAEIEINGLEFSGLAFLPLDDTISLYGRLGAFAWNADVEIMLADGSSDRTNDDDGSDLFYGVGSQLKLSDNMRLKVEYDIYRVLDDDVDLFGLGLDIGF